MNDRNRDVGFRVDSFSNRHGRERYPLPQDDDPLSTELECLCQGGIDCAGGREAVVQLHEQVGPPEPTGRCVGQIHLQTMRL